MAFHSGIQSGQLLQKAGSARSNKALVFDKRSDEVHKDRWAFGASCQEVDIPACRGDGESGYVRRNAGADRKASFQSWIARRVGKGNRDQIEAALGKLRHLLGELGLKEPVRAFRSGLETLFR